jgi:N-acetylglucosaminyldiphosphoundecaprenol N-acetyl-beta-D-mannosaminyltransferase
MSFRTNILGAEVDAMTMADVFTYIDEAVDKNQHRIIGHHNLHSIYLFQRDRGMREFYRRADRIIIDGMSLVISGRLADLPVHRTNRVSWTDMVHPLIAHASQKNWRVYFLGGSPGVPERATQTFRDKHATLQMRSHHGYLSHMDGDGDVSRMIDEINAFKPNVLLVGMGMPKQEHWILENSDALHFNAICTVGACMDYVVGEKKLPPRWLGPIGLEWTYRLFTEPRRLFRRYLIEPWHILRFIMKG